MASRLTEIVIDSVDPQRLAAFWAAVLDYRTVALDDGEFELEGPGGFGPTILFAKVPESKAVKNRIHLDVNATDRDQQAEVERIIALGARPVDIGQGDVSWVVLADPEGNEFCVLRRRVTSLPEPLASPDA